ncbi:frataxin-like protein [marine gamma proteobacterium HTCC2080]|nr:frataxin-like protein [marine gamma proteobacterium HTCC2080]
MSSATYFDRIDETFNCVETRLEELPEDPDLSVAEGVINARFSNGVVFVFSRQPPTEQLWLATPGGGFHYVWDDASGDWRDTKTADLFRDFLPKQLLEHAQVEFAWE